MVETCWAGGSYQNGKEEAIAQALKRAEDILRERALIQSSSPAKIEMNSPRSRSQKSFFSDFTLNSPLPTLMGNPIGAPSPYFCGLGESLMTPLGENLYGMLGMRYGYITGDTTYHISFAGGASELEFPLDNSLLGIEGALGYRGPYNGKQDRARLTLWWLTDVEHDAGKMKDSDWIDDDASFLGIPGYSHPGLDIYSEMDAELDTYLFDINYVYNFLPADWLGIGPMFGYRYQRFEYSNWNLDQVGYGLYGPAGYTYKDPYGWKWIEYEVRYHIFYLGLNTDILLGDTFWLNFHANYMPWVNVEDEDTHLYPDYDAATGYNKDKISKGDCDGDGYLLNINATWEFLPDWLLQAGGEYVNIDTDGSQSQYRYIDGVLYSSTTSGIHDEITSSYWLIFANLKCRF